MNQEELPPYPCILVVEDNSDLRQILKLLIEHQFLYHVVEARDGEEAIKLAHREKPVLILMDLVMPHMNGLEAISVIRDSPEIADIPIIVVSSECWDVTVKERAQSCGGTVCLDKVHLFEQLPGLIAPILKDSVNLRKH